MAVEIPLSRLRAIAAAPSDSLVRVWTLQHPEAVQEARRSGRLRGNPEFSLDPEDVGDDGRPTGYSFALRWLQGKMAERIPSFSGDLPIFAWLKRPSAKPWPASFGPLVRVCAIVPRRRLLLSLHDGFLCVANGTRLPGAPSDGSMEASWERIFDPSSTGMWSPRGRQLDDKVQACLDGIHVSEIVSARRLPVRGPAGRRPAGPGEESCRD